MNVTLLRWALVCGVAITCGDRACSADFTVGAHLATAHFARHPNTDLRPETPGAYARVAAGRWAGLTVGAFRNSYGRTSTYAGFSWESRDRSFALLLGAVTGYSAARVMPLVAPSARIPITDSAALRIALLPKPVKQGHSAALHLATEIDF